MIAAVRPDDWNFALLLHVAGAAVLVGAVLVVAWALVGAIRADDRAGTAALARFGYRTLLFWVVPAYVVMRVGAEWIYSKEDFGETDPDWVGVGYGVSDLGLLILIVTTVMAGISARRFRDGTGSSLTLARVSAGLTALLLVMYVVALWAMTAKPG